VVSDRDAFRENRAAGLRARHETREARAIRKQVAEEIAQAIEANQDEIGDGEQREIFADMATLAREIGAQE